MTDQYGSGRWGTGDRPLGTGPAQSAWDKGAQDRRFEEQRKRSEELDRHYKKQSEDQRRREEEYRRNGARAAPPAAGTPSSDDDLDFEDYLLLAAVGGLTFLLVSFWNSVIGQFHPTNVILSAIVNHGAWAVGATGLFLGWRFQGILLRFAKIILWIALLFFGSAIAFGLYKGITGAG